MTEKEQIEKIAKDYQCSYQLAEKILISMKLNANNQDKLYK